MRVTRGSFIPPPRRSRLTRRHSPREESLHHPKRWISRISLSSGAAKALIQKQGGISGKVGLTLMVGLAAYFGDPMMKLAGFSILGMMTVGGNKKNRETKAASHSRILMKVGGSLNGLRAFFGMIRKALFLFPRNREEIPKSIRADINDDDNSARRNRGLARLDRFDLAQLKLWLAKETSPPVAVALIQKIGAGNRGDPVPILIGLLSYDRHSWPSRKKADEAMRQLQGLANRGALNASQARRIVEAMLSREPAIHARRDDYDLLKTALEILANDSDPETIALFERIWEQSSRDGFFDKIAKQALLQIEARLAPEKKPQDYVTDLRAAVNPSAAELAASAIRRRDWRFASRIEQNAFTAAETFGNSKKPEFLEFLLQGAESPILSVRLAALKGAVQIWEANPHLPVEILRITPFLHDSDIHMIILAVQALFLSGKRAALPHLIRGQTRLHLYFPHSLAPRPQVALLNSPRWADQHDFVKVAIYSLQARYGTYAERQAARASLENLSEMHQKKSLLDLEQFPHFRYTFKGLPLSFIRMLRQALEMSEPN